MFYKKKYNELKIEWDKQNKELDNMNVRFSKKLKEKDSELERVRNLANLLLEKNNKLDEKMSIMCKKFYGTSNEINKNVQKKCDELVLKNRMNISKLANLSKKNKKLEQELEKARQIVIALQEELSTEKKKFKPSANEIKEYYRKQRSVEKC